MTHWTHVSKWHKYTTMLKEPALRPHLPQTNIFSEKYLYEYLNRYSSVYLKPVVGTGGYGIIKLTRNEDSYLLQTPKRKIIFKNEKTLYRGITSIINKRVYLIQQGIDLLSINNRSIDFRILILKPYNKWEVMGVMGKLGAKNKIVTNKVRGGRPISLQDALSRSLQLTDREISAMEDKLLSLGLKSANALSKDFGYVREVGLDVAIDSNLNLWILEANSMPNFSLFKYHKDKTLYLKVARYILHIRRNYRRKFV